MACDVSPVAMFLPGLKVTAKSIIFVCKICVFLPALCFPHFPNSHYLSLRVSDLSEKVSIILPFFGGPGFDSTSPERSRRKKRK